jgi:hypothetical protein
MQIPLLDYFLSATFKMRTILPTKGVLVTWFLVIMCQISPVNQKHYWDSDRSKGWKREEESEYSG